MKLNEVFELPSRQKSKFISTRKGPLCPGEYILSCEPEQQRLIYHEVLKVVHRNKKGVVAVYLKSGDPIKLGNSREKLRITPEVMERFKPEFKKIQARKTTTQSPALFAKVLTKLITRIIPEERLDITISEDGIQVIIHYPEITIRNSAGQSHKIYDFWAQIWFYSNRRCMSYPLYSRTTFYDHELHYRSESSTYMHSHLPTTDRLRDWKSDFCYGNTPIGLVMNRLANPDTFDLLDISKFLIQLESTLAWESLEGTPYCYMSNLQDNKLVKADLGGDYEVYPIAETFYPFVIEAMNAIPFDIDNVGKTSFSNTIKEYIHDVVTQVLINQEVLQYIFLYQDGYSFIDPNSADKQLSRFGEDNQGNKSRVTFKNETINIKIIPNDTTELTKGMRKRAHVTLVDCIISMLHKDLEHVLLTNYEKYV